MNETCGIIVIIRRNKAHILFLEMLYLQADFHIISTESGQVFYNHKVDVSCMNVREHSLKCGTVEVRTAVAVITVKFIACDSVALTVLFQ